MILATQSLKELEESSMLQIVAESCPTKVFLANPAMDRELYREAFHLNDTELDLIDGLVTARPDADSGRRSRARRCSSMLKSNRGRWPVAFDKDSEQAK
jgi:hypothetical protein